MSDGLSDSKNLALDKQFRRRYFRVPGGREITMECPKNKDHMGIKVVKNNGEDRSLHYAELICKECGEWIKWLSQRDYENAMEGRGAEEPTDTEESDADRMKRCFGEARTIIDVKHYKQFPEELLLQIAFKLYDGRGK